MAPPVGRVLFMCRRGERIDGRERLRPLAQADYELIGRSVELLEQLAGTRASNGAVAATGARTRDRLGRPPHHPEPPKIEPTKTVNRCIQRRDGAPRQATLRAESPRGGSSLRGSLAVFNGQDRFRPVEGRAP